LDAALDALEAGVAGLGSPFLRGARVFFVSPKGSAALTSAGVWYATAMVSSATVDFSRLMFGNSFRRQTYRSIVHVAIRRCTYIQDETGLYSEHIDATERFIEC
jgi:hypothetical protein